VITPGEKARESWNGIFSMYSAADAQSGRARKSASRRSMMIPPLSINAYGAATLGVDRRAVHPLAVEGHDDVTAGIDGDEAAIALQARQVRYRSVSGFLELLLQVADASGDVVREHAAHECFPESGAGYRTRAV